MADIKTFHLPDLGEGLPDATIVEWHVKEGDEIKLDAPLCSMETAKAVVDVPSPYTGKVVKLHGKAGDVIETGAELADFEPDPNARQRAESQETGHSHGPKKKKAKADKDSETSDKKRKVVASDDGGEIEEGDEERADSGTVVGAMQASDTVQGDRISTAGGVKAMPAVRALARKLGVELGEVEASGAEGVITLADVRQAAESGGGKRAGRTSGRGRGAGEQTTRAAPQREARRTSVSSGGKPVRTRPPSEQASGQPEQLKGVRRNMARVMANSHAQIVPTSIFDDADLGAWLPGNDITARIIRALITACREVPALNAWFDGENLTRTLHPHVDIGLAVDTEDGLFVPAIRNADVLDDKALRQSINRLRSQVEDRSIPGEELKGYTIMLSNFGMFAGRYATPVIVPPCVAIIGAGRMSHQPVAVMGGIEVHRVLPLSVTFDHRAATGGEAARFLKAMMDDLGLPQ